MDRKLIWVMAIANCIVVSNIYYSQPLLVEIMRSFHITQQSASLLPVVTQAGYALGLLFAVPLSDMMERKKLILICIAMAGLFLFCVALSPTFFLLCTFSLFMGIFSIVPQMLIPFAAGLAREEERGRILGMVMSGLLLGILLSRSFAGFVGGQFGWRSIYWLAGLLMFLLLAVLRLLLPQSPGTYRGSYRELMASIADLWVEFPLLRASALIGACLFAALNLFWSNLAFLLATAPYHYGAGVAGLFGLLGAGGALGAPLVGHFADRLGTVRMVYAGIALELLSFLLLIFAGYHLWALISFVFLVDLAQQISHISNQSRIFSLKPEARSRLNTVYMFSAFAGAALGSAIGSFAWACGRLAGIGWAAVILLGLAFSINFISSRRALARQYL